ncbi:siphovirus Gp157 family protein [Comamonas sp. 4034]|uniref:siphovirus Gp157 family protein n=1 Tax=Comamonas sp. 4034 TaxID=3156455 RepID=UPI003D1DAB32
MTAVTLYQLKGQWLELASQLADMDLDAQTIADTIEGSDVQMALEEKVQGYEMVARNLEAHVPAIQAEVKRLQAMEKRLTTRADALRDRVKTSMKELGIQKIACPLFEMRIQKNPDKLDVFEEALVPDEFWHTPPKQIDKAKLKEAIKAGADIQGARLTQGDSLRIS